MHAQACDTGLRSRDRRGLGLLFLDFQMGNFSFDLRLEFIRGAAKFGKKTPGLASHFRQLLGAKYDQGQEENEDGVGKTHSLIIMRRGRGGNASADNLYNFYVTASLLERTLSTHGAGLRTMVLRSSPAMIR